MMDKTVTSRMKRTDRIEPRCMDNMVDHMLNMVSVVGMMARNLKLELKGKMNLIWSLETKFIWYFSSKLWSTPASSDHFTLSVKSPTDNKFHCPNPCILHLASIAPMIPGCTPNHSKTH